MIWSRAHKSQPIQTHQHEFVAIPLASRLCRCWPGVVMQYRICPSWSTNQRRSQPDPYKPLHSFCCVIPRSRGCQAICVQGCAKGVVWYDGSVLYNLKIWAEGVAYWPIGDGVMVSAHVFSNLSIPPHVQKSIVFSSLSHGEGEGGEANLQ